ncbi:MAG TPA: fibronectin type III domain-containing protein, partial [Micromonospora sp.]
MPVRKTLRAVVGLGAAAALVLVASAPATAARPAPLADRTPPSQPTGFTATAVTTTSVTFTWNPSTDNVGVMSYSLWAEGLGLGIVPVPHPQTTGTWTLGLRPGTTYTFGVQAWDAAYNGSAVSWLNVTTLPDVIAPTTPGDLRVDAVSASKVLLNWTSATDDVDEVTYEVLVNGVPSP